MSVSSDNQLNCPPSLYKYKNHACRFCQFRSVYKHVTKLHEWRKHLRKNHTQITTSSNVNDNNKKNNNNKNNDNDTSSSSSTTTTNLPLNAPPKTSDQIIEKNNDSDTSSSTTGTINLPLNAPPKTSDQMNENLNTVPSLEHNTTTSSAENNNPSLSPPTDSIFENSEQINNKDGTFSPFSDPMIEKNRTFDLRLVENPKIAIFGPSRAGII